MKKTFGKQAMRIMAAALVMVLLMVSMASGEQSAWDCPECGRTGNLWNYCGNCAHPAPWTKEEGFDEEKAYDAVLKQIEAMNGSIDSLNNKLVNVTQESLTYTNSDGKNVTFYFRVNNVTLSVLVSKGDHALKIPTSWVSIGTLSNIRPISDRYLSINVPGGVTVMMKISTNGSVQIQSDVATDIWMQGSGTVIIQ